MSWRQNTDRDLRLVNRSWSDAHDLAEDRAYWSALTASCWRCRNSSVSMWNIRPDPRSRSPNLPTPRDKAWGNLAEQHRSGRQAVGNGREPSPDCPVGVITRPEYSMHGLSNADERRRRLPHASGDAEASKSTKVIVQGKVTRHAVSINHTF